MLRECVLESLGRAMSLGGMLRGISMYLSMSGPETAIDIYEMAAGTGQAGLEVARDLAPIGMHASCHASDIHPLHEKCRNEDVAYCESPVDATDFDPMLVKNSLVLITNLCHHLSRIALFNFFSNAGREARCIVIAEIMTKSIKSLAAAAILGLTSTIINPLLTNHRCVLKLILTWIIPIAPIAVAVDGITSWSRLRSLAQIKSEAEACVPHMKWNHVQISYKFGGSTDILVGTRVG